MAKSTKKEVQVSLETVLWNCRVALRGIGSTEKNRDAVIGLVFLKFAGDKFEKRRAELIKQYGEIPAFLEKGLKENPMKCEYFLPSVVSNLLESERATVQVLESEDKWYGVTYKEDKPVVVAAVQALKDEGLYPQKLWD